MSKAEDISGIADATKPNVGRIYDFFLGGSHNFEVDRIQAAMIQERIPLMPKICRLVRWFLSETIHNLLDAGFTQFIDFAAGLPTQDHIHQLAPSGTKVVYSDLDPITVTYANEIIGNNPDVLYLHCDVKNPTEILESDAVAALFDKEKKTAIGMNGITYFMEDEILRRSLEVVYKWAQKGDRLYLCDTDGLLNSESDEDVKRMYAQMGNPIYIHSVETMSRLVGEWKPIPPGYRPLEEWVKIANTPLSFLQEEKEAHGGNFYGVILEK